jgi:hypothetical protein
MRYVFVMALIVAVVALSLLADRGSRGQPSTVTGIVTEWRPGESIRVANDQTDPHFRIALRHTTYEGNVTSLKPGVRVTVWYRSVGERLPVADRVRVLSGSR